ncbi:YceI family protein [Tsuneonella sp. HG222]
MKKLFVAVPALALGLAALSPGQVATAAASNAPAWTIQPGGELGFAVAQDGTDIVGKFAKWGGQINFDPDAPAEAAIAIDIDLLSSTVNDGYKDSLLHGDEFFDANANPTATFRSTSVEALPDGRFIAHGDLSLRSLSVAQDVEFRLTGSGDTRRVEGKADINRLPFGVGTGSHGDGIDQTVGVTFAFDAKRG